MRIATILFALLTATPAMADRHGGGVVVRDHRDTVVVRDHREGGVRVVGPRGAPPRLREEHWKARPGYVWVRGRYAWRGGTYVWMPGYYERERVGYVWREPVWTVQGGVYVETPGAWVVVQ